MTDHDDDALRARLRAVDPAAALPPIPAAQRDRLLENAMTSTETTVTPLRRRAPWLIGGGVVLVAAAAATIALTTGGTDITRLTETVTDPMTMCAMVTPEALQAETLAFAATVTGVDGTTVTLEVTDTYKGEVGDEVQVTQQEASADDFSAVQYSPGAGYLIAATDGRVASCGRSGPTSPELQQLYTQAFGG